MQSIQGVPNIRKQTFRMLYYEMETFCKQADEKTSVILQYYVNKYKCIYGIYTLWCYITAIGVICGPLVFPQEFPTHAKYPFSITQAIKILVYLHQSLVGLQVAAGMCIDCNIAILLFYSAVKLELLAQEFRNVKNESELDACINLHNEILSSQWSFAGPHKSSVENSHDFTRSDQTLPRYSLPKF
ncbi:uncharacterized protein [Cardiocondyla obscurior]|uniref:uncharacterized protein n=1 Tax=Cardiocondyla obscurior TaxID=286306 RepID=UPI0039657B53